MREIKFRAWHKGMRKMYKCRDLLLSFREKEISISTADKENIDYHGYTPRKNTTIVLMQYTGLKDKNGVDVYESDLLLSINHRDNGSDEVVKIYYGDAGFNYMTLDGKFNWLSYIPEDTREVIGNIHENPELLDGN